MIINSNFHQYYDTFAKQSTDSTVLYDRYSSILPLNFARSGFNKNLISFNNQTFEFPDYFRAASTRVEIGKKRYATAILSFCGAPFLMHVLYNDSLNKNIIYNLSITEDYYSDDSLSFLLYSDFHSRDKWLQSLLNLMSYDFNKLHNFLKSPVFLIGGCVGGKIEDGSYYLNFSEHRIEINPNLDALKFYKIIDSWRTYDKLYSYLSGVLGSDKTVPENISDKDRLLQHGFDLKTSFRNPIR